MEAAVSPPTCAFTAVPATTGGITSLRSVCTNCSVCDDWGDVVGYTMMTAPVSDALNSAGVTKAMPSWCPASVPSSRLTVPTSEGPCMSAATTSGPLNPGPNPCARRS